jgi:hypothetical protein
MKWTRLKLYEAYVGMQVNGYVAGETQPQAALFSQMVARATGLTILSVLRREANLLGGTVELVLRARTFRRAILSVHSNRFAHCASGVAHQNASVHERPADRPISINIALWSHPVSGCYSPC